MCSCKNISDNHSLHWYQNKLQSSLYFVSDVFAYMRENQDNKSNFNITIFYC